MVHIVIAYLIVGMILMVIDIESWTQDTAELYQNNIELCIFVTLLGIVLFPVLYFSTLLFNSLNKRR